MLHKFQKGLRLKVLGKQEISRKSLKCLDLMVNTQPAIQNANFGI